MVRTRRGNRDHEENEFKDDQSIGRAMSQPNLCAVKVIAKDVAKGNMSVSSLANCIIILVDEIKELKSKMEDRGE